jgi:hypothetical protein
MAQKIATEKTQTINVHAGIPTSAAAIKVTMIDFNVSKTLLF